jgi:neutral ceramidase
MHRTLLIALVFGLAGVSQADTPESQELKVGVGTVEITPPAGYRMSGYFNERFNTGVHDPLYAKALVFRQGTAGFAWVMCDIIGPDRWVSSQARKEIAARTGLPLEGVMIHGTHSHTGPLYKGVMRSYFHERAIKKDGKDAAEDVDYAEFLREKIVDAVLLADASRQPLVLRTGTLPQPGIAFNRRFHMKDGTVRFNPGRRNPDIVRVAGPIDPDVSVLSVQTAQGEPIACLTSLALHLDTVGGTNYSADFPFALEKTLQARFGPKFVSLFGTGTCGDINHIDVMGEARKSGSAEAARIGVTLGTTVSDGWDALQPLKAPKLGFAARTFDWPMQEYTPEQTAAAQANLAKIGSSELSFLDQVTAVKIAEIAARKKDRPDGTVSMRVQAYRLSDSAAVVALPGEVFVELGLAIKQASPFAWTAVIELSEDSPAYIPTEKAFKEGSYETVNSIVKPGAGEKLVETAIELLSKLKSE